MPKRRTTVWVDAGGRTTAHLMTTATGAAALQAAVAAKSNAAVEASWEGDLTVTPAPAPVAAQYQTVADVAVLQYETASGASVTLRIPAPQASIFMADGMTVDPAQVSGITALALTDLITPDGHAVTHYVGGFRYRK